MDSITSNTAQWTAKNIVVNVRITSVNTNDVDPVPDILDGIEKRLRRMTTYMGVDAGYRNAPICHQIASRGIQPIVGYRRHTNKGERFIKYRFVYLKDRNTYLCPQKQELLFFSGLKPFPAYINLPEAYEHADIPKLVRDKRD